MASPEDTPMKKQWLEVDGRMTPVILPQIWNHDKEEWEVTSEQNPLPTQVTGSNVELYPNVEIASGETFRTDAINSNLFNTIIVTLSDRGSNRIREELEMRVSFF